MERICEPNLPKGRVRRAFISALMPDDIVQELNDMGVITYRLGKSANMCGELAYHPDLLLNNYRAGSWICEYNAKYLPRDFPMRSMIYESELELGDLYPSDCIFNNFRLQDTLYTGMSCDHLIESYAKYDDVIICRVRQNYVKCSTVLVTERAAITSDKYLGKMLKQRGNDVLQLPMDSDEDVELSNMSHGLLGGCAAKLSKDLLVFTGNLHTFKYCDEIVDFCKNHGVDTLSLTNRHMYDYGGILPISELVPYDELLNVQMEFGL